MLFEMNTHNMVATPYKEVRSVKSNKKKKFREVEQKKENKQKIIKLYFVTREFPVYEEKG